ncbi:MAG: hypothetical protein AAFV53_35705 [Myxococcota bacterium]
MRTLSMILLAGCAKTGGTGPAAEPARAHRYALRAADFVAQPARLDELMTQYFDVKLLIEARYADGGPLRLDVASIGEDGESQNTCAPTQAFDDLDLGEGGAFTAAADSLRFVTDGTPVELVDFSIAGTIAAEKMTASRIEGVVDTATLKGLMGSDDPDAICTLVGKILPCEPCPHNDHETCWTVVLDAVDVPAVETGLTVRGADAICADPTCAEAPTCAAP